MRGDCESREDARRVAQREKTAEQGGGGGGGRCGKGIEAPAAAEAKGRDTGSRARD